MSNEENKSVRGIFAAAVEIKDLQQRQQFLDNACSNDPGLRSQVDSLLAAHAGAGEMFSTGDFRSSENANQPADYQNTTNTDAILDYSKSETIGPYKLLQEIGSGGMGQVWMAQQEQPVRRRVALKLIKAGMDTKLVIARFEAERQALALMDHPNIAKVFDAGTASDGRPFFVMEYVRGKPITKFADANQMTITERLEMFEQVCHAVQHAHHKGVIHRDLKPSNVLVTANDGRPHAKVIDFGVAKAVAQQLTDLTLFTMHDQFIGTPQYMSPEQAEGSVDIDTRTDVYSLGVILYELLAGSTPFDKEELRAAGLERMKRMIIEQDPPRPSTRVSLSAPTLDTLAASRRIEPRKLGLIVRGELDWIVMKALDKDRKRRYETPSSFAEDVVAYLIGEPIDAAPPSRRYRLQKFVRRNRGGVIVGSAISGALGLGILGTSWGYIHAQRLAELERKANVDLTIALDTAETARRAAELESYIANLGLAQTAMKNDNWPNARQRLAACPESLRGWEWKFFNKQASAIVAKLPTSRFTRDPIPSTLQDAIICFLDDRTIRVFNFQGQPLGPPIDHPERIESVIFNLDSGHFTTSCKDGTVRSWSFGSKLTQKIDGLQGNNGGLLLAREEMIACTNSSPTGLFFAILRSDSDSRTLKKIVWSGAIAPKELVLAAFHGNITAIDLSGDEVWNIQTPNAHWDRFELNQQGTFLLAKQIGNNEAHSISLFSVDGKVIADPFVDGEDCEAAFSNRGNLVVTSSADEGTKIWQLESNQIVELFKLSHTGTQPEVVLSSDETTLVATTFTSQPTWTGSVYQGGEGDLSIWNLPGKVELSHIPIEGRDYYPTLDISKNGQLIWGKFGQNNKPEFRNTAGKLVGFPEGNLRFNGNRELQQPEFPISSGDDGIWMWDKTGAISGRLGISVRNDGYGYEPVLERGENLLLGDLIINLQHFDDGVMYVPVGPLGVCQVGAIVESGRLPANAVLQVDAGEPVYSLDETFNKESAGYDPSLSSSSDGDHVACVLPGQNRIVVSDGELTRILDAKSKRELASIYPEKTVAKLEATEDGQSLIVHFRDGTGVIWDTIDLQKKREFWKTCAAQRDPAEAYLESLFASDVPNEKLTDSVLADQSISAVLRLGIMQLCLDKLEQLKSDAKAIVGPIRTPYPYERLNRLNEWKKKSTNAPVDVRLNAQVVSMLKTEKLHDWKLTENEIDNFLQSICIRPGKGSFETAFSVAKRAVGDFPESEMMLHYAGCAQMRLGNFDDAIEWLEKSEKLAAENDRKIVANQICLALIKVAKGDVDRAKKILADIETELTTESGLSNYEKSLLNEARTAIGK